jgi:hypothetical protein
MKHLKTVTLLGLAVAFMAPFAVNAQATTLTSAGATYTGKVTGEATDVVIHRKTESGAAFNITCNKSTISGQVVGHGLAVTTSIKLESLLFQECYGYGGVTETKILKPGVLEIHTAPGDAGGTTGNGTVTWGGSVFELTTAWQSTGLSEHCIFKLSNADIGPLTGSKATGATAKLNIDALLGTSFYCGLYAELTANYTITTPDNLNVD